MTMNKTDSEENISSYKENLLKPAFKCKNLSSLSKDHLFQNQLKFTSKEKSFFKNFENKSNYLDDLKIFLNSTEETKHCGEFIIEKVIPTLQNKKNFLDIGPGDGQLTKTISGNFFSTTVIDPNPKILSQLNSEDILSGKNVHMIQDSILDTALPTKHFDLCLLSHVLYYIDRDKWLSVAKKMYNAVSPKGVLIIVLSGEHSGKSELISHFGGSIININAFTKECFNHITTKIEAFSFKEKFLAKSSIIAIKIACFLLNDAGVRAKPNDVLNYLNKKHRKSNGDYEIDSDQNIIILYK